MGCEIAVDVSKIFPPSSLFHIFLLMEFPSSPKKKIYMLLFFFFLKSIALKENVSLRHTCFPARHKTLGSKHGRLVFEEEEDTNEEARTLPGITTLGNSAGQHC